MKKQVICLAMIVYITMMLMGCQNKIETLEAENALLSKELDGIKNINEELEQDRTNIMEEISSLEASNELLFIESGIGKYNFGLTTEEYIAQVKFLNDNPALLKNINLSAGLNPNCKFEKLSKNYVTTYTYTIYQDEKSDSSVILELLTLENDIIYHISLYYNAPSSTRLETDGFNYFLNYSQIMAHAYPMAHISPSKITDEVLFIVDEIIYAGRYYTKNLWLNTYEDEDHICVNFQTVGPTKD